MKRLLLLALLLVACDGALPTDPERRVQTDDAFPFEMDPPVVRMTPGSTRDVVIRAPWTYPLGVAFGSTDDAVMRVSGRIESGAAEGVAHITAVAAGTAQVRLTVWNFARAPGSREVGVIVVGAGTAKRRAVR